MEEVIMPILNTDSGSVKKDKMPPVEETPRETKTSSAPALPFMERIETWLQEAGPREQLFAVALDLMLSRKETIKKVTGRDVYKDMIEKYQDTVCRIAGGQENLDKADDEDEAMAAALAAIVTFS
jgi:hypothetical protein